MFVWWTIDPILKGNSFWWRNAYESYAHESNTNEYLYFDLLLLLFSSIMNASSFSLRFLNRFLSGKVLDFRHIAERLGRNASLSFSCTRALDALCTHTSIDGDLLDSRSFLMIVPVGRATCHTRRTFTLHTDNFSLLINTYVWFIAALSSPPPPPPHSLHIFNSDLIFSLPILCTWLLNTPNRNSFQHSREKTKYK